MNCMVYVNGKYMVSIEAESNSQAEHIFLDIPGVTTALSFDPDAMKTETFVGCMLGAKTISYNEMLNKANSKLADIYEHYNQMLDDERDAKVKIADLERQLEYAKEDLKLLEENRDEYIKEADKHSIMLRFHGYTPVEKIEELRRPVKVDE